MAGRDSVVEFINAYVQDEHGRIDIVLDQGRGRFSISVRDLEHDRPLRRMSLGQAVSLVSGGLGRRPFGVMGGFKKP